MRTVLIVDDSMAMRAVVKQGLVEGGFGVLEAANADEAYGKLDGTPVHLILCDFNMPGTDGLTFIKQMKANPAFSAYRFVPVVIMTSESDSDKKQMGRDAGVSAWIVKPFVVASLVSAVSKLALPA